MSGSRSIRRLHPDRALRLRGAVRAIATRRDISRAVVYDYLKLAPAGVAPARRGATAHKVGAA
jgi:predicted transcriptional regulator YheO